MSKKEKEAYISRRSKKKGMTRGEVETEIKQAELGGTIPIEKSDSADKRNVDVKKLFMVKFYDERKGATTEEAEQAWKNISEAQFKLDKLPITAEFKKVEDCLRIIYMNQPKPPIKEQLQKALERYKNDWKRKQANLKTMKIIAEFDPEADFRKKIMNPKTREEAINRYLAYESGKHFLIQALKILFEQLDKRR